MMYASSWGGSRALINSAAASASVSSIALKTAALLASDSRRDFVGAGRAEGIIAAAGWQVARHTANLLSRRPPRHRGNTLKLRMGDRLSSSEVGSLDYPRDLGA